jgi:acyl dehydratase
VTDGPFVEDFKVGDVHRSSTGRTISQAANIWFFLLTNNTNPSTSTGTTPRRRSSAGRS